jgi:membrane protein
LLVTAALSAMGNLLAPTFSVIAMLFAMMFKWLPDVVIGWRDVLSGAVLTAALFEIGKQLIGIYIGKQGLESTYGAAASIVVVLICLLLGPACAFRCRVYTRLFRKIWPCRAESQRLTIQVFR